MIKTIIVDDEPLAQDVIETHLEKLDDLELIAKCNNVEEAKEILKTVDIDLIFLDIQMPQITGIDFVKTLQDPPAIVFTTAYDNYAIEGFELNAVDYLLKPISLERFMKAVNKVRDRFENNHRAEEDEGGIANADYMFVKADKKLIKVNFDDIIYIEGLKDYVIIRMKEGRVITLQTMKSLEAKLPKKKFLRIHRSYIVGLEKIQAIVGNMVEVTEKNQAKHLPIGKNYREQLQSMVEKKRL
ncbi:MAG: LytTR family DNA-binding domain-containing protein [Bacteroidia bacterium]|nr:LytTR family DNA-binding domain-containing protein [Bacteroidia bacterium]